jgi:hypothetical protein
LLTGIALVVVGGGLAGSEKMMAHGTAEYVIAASIGCFGAGPTASAEEQGRTEDLRSISLSVKLVRELYCGNWLDPHNTLHLRLAVTAQNNRERAVIVARQTGPVLRQGVARTEEEGLAGGFVSGYEGVDEVYTIEQSRALPALNLGAIPDPKQFVVLRPGTDHVFHITTAVPVKRLDANALDGWLDPGANYFVRINVSFWPFRGTPKSEVDYVRTRWFSVGDLVVGGFETELVRFRVPDSKPLVPCPVNPFDDGGR